MGNQGVLTVAGLVPGATSATGETNLRLLAKTKDQLRADAERNQYPKWVRPSKDAAKVLVQDETEHREKFPGDFPSADEPKGKKKVD